MGSSLESDPGLKLVPTLTSCDPPGARPLIWKHLLRWVLEVLDPKVGEVKGTSFS